ncbi:hypothetical protein [Sorangium sp. So ce385]|uniref:hypothetical protein n=1 Tax=Sorangium sp. So ce385 TaxID=3133308 RepID=UPI003F5AEAF9
MRVGDDRAHGEPSDDTRLPVDRSANELIALGGGVGEAVEGTTSVESLLLE